MIAPSDHRSLVGPWVCRGREAPSRVLFGPQGSSAYGRPALRGPSRVADVGTGEVPLEMAQPEIDARVEGFGAALAADAGLDGVEINAGHRAGDVLSPRRLDRAVLEGDRIAGSR